MKHARNTSGLIWANHHAESVRRSSSRQCQGWHKDQRRLPSWEARFGWQAKISNEESATHLARMLEAGDEQQFLCETCGRRWFSASFTKGTSCGASAETFPGEFLLGE